jgi:hypothetical protein
MITIKLSNWTGYTILVVFIVLIVLGIAISYGDFSSGDASIIGHSSDELDLKIGADTYSLQEAINNGLILNSLQIKVAVLECSSGGVSCSSRGTPNNICSTKYGAGWKALSVDCGEVEVLPIYPLSDPNNNKDRDRTMDSNLDWCIDSDGEDMAITCYKSG